MPRLWPWPGDTQLDIARTIAREALRRLAATAPDMHDELVKDCTRFGQGWVAPHPDECPPGERVSDAVAGARVGKEASTIRNWNSDPETPVWRMYGGYSVQEVLAWDAELRRRRAIGSGSARLGEPRPTGGDVERPVRHH